MHVHTHAHTHMHTRQRGREKKRERATELFFWDPESFNDSKLCCDGVRQRGSPFRGHTHTRARARTNTYARTNITTGNNANFYRQNEQIYIEPKLR